MAGRDQKKSPEPAKEPVAAPPRRSQIGTLIGLAASAVLCVATLWVITQFLKHRPLDLLDSTQSVGVVAADVLRHQGLSTESIETSEPHLNEQPGAHFFHTDVEAHLPDTVDPERVMNALERAFWRKQMVVASEDAAESELSAILSYEGFEVAEIRLHHAPKHIEKAHAVEHEKIEHIPQPAELEHAPEQAPQAEITHDPEHAEQPVTHEAPVEEAVPSAEHTPAETKTEAESTEHAAPAIATPAGTWAPAFGPIVAGERPKIAQALARVAIIVDDGGYGGEPTDIILGLDPALTIAVLPNTPQATKLANDAQQRGFEVMLHMPMENTSRTLVHPGQLDGEMDGAEMARLTKSALEQVPGAVGINNHEGSKFTTNAKALGRFMDGIDDTGLYFVDSRTTQESVAFEVARQFGIRSATCTLFLDHENEPAAIRARFQEMIDEARAHGTAIAICHFRPNTAVALRELLPSLSAAGIQLVHASELVR